MNAPTFPASLESLQRRDVAEAIRDLLVINVVCAAVAVVALGWLA